MESTTPSLIWFIALSAVPLAFVTLTSFLKLYLVFSILHNALGLKQLPATLIVTGISAVFTAFIMMPVGARVDKNVTQNGGSWQQVLNAPGDLWPNARKPVLNFLSSNAGADELSRLKDVSTKIHGEDAMDTQHPVLIAAGFVLTELKEALLMGFLLFLPFLVVDIVVAALLTVLGMNQLPTPYVTLPVKLILFVAVDGWSLLVDGLMTGYGAA